MNQLFKVIPVLDLKDGIVVHGIKGDRERYQPLKSVLTPSADISNVLHVFYEQFGLCQFYLADLDAIMSGGSKNQLHYISAHSNSKLSFMVDAAVKDSSDLYKIMRIGVNQVVIGTETLLSLDALTKMIRDYGPEQFVVSMDIKNSKIISPSSEIARFSPPQLIEILTNLGIPEVILLEIDRVGSLKGLNHELIWQCLSASRQACGQSKTVKPKLILGGGITSYEDLRWSANKGLAGVLVASAFHNGNITPEAIHKLREPEKASLIEGGRFDGNRSGEN